MSFQGTRGQHPTDLSPENEDDIPEETVAPGQHGGDKYDAGTSSQQKAEYNWEVQKMISCHTVSGRLQLVEFPMRQLAVAVYVRLRSKAGTGDKNGYKIHEDRLQDVQ
nr:hypothetical protein BaRGS_004966 [Batillaria attramentaria]